VPRWRDRPGLTSSAAGFQAAAAGINRLADEDYSDFVRAFIAAF
jgi:mevalonate pyrophosphate decarboxylase